MRYLVKKDKNSTKPTNICLVVRAFRGVNIGEYCILIFCLFFLVIYLFLSKKNDIFSALYVGLLNIKIGINWFFIVVLFIFFYFLIRFYISFISRFNKICQDNKRFKLKLIYKSCYNSAREEVVFLFYFLKYLFLLIIFMSFSSLLFGELAIKLQDSLVNSYLMRLDYKLFGFYPFMELSQTGSPWQIFVPVVFFAFYGLSSLMSLLFAFLLFSNKSRELLVGYIISISLAVVIAMPIWFKFPANSPQNAYINNVYGHKIEENISISLASHKPNSYVDRAYKLSGVKPGSVAPVTTMPSMHVAWGFILLFYFYRLSKKFVFIILPWFVFSSFGTFYLGQHYFVDVPVGLLIGVVADYLGRQLVKLEKKYYQPNWLDRLEERVKGSVALDTRIVFSIIKKLLNKFNIYLNFLKLKRNITER